jgi:hypothetical protein
MARAAMQEVVRSIFPTDEAEAFINEHALDFTVHVLAFHGPGSNRFCGRLLSWWLPPRNARLIGYLLSALFPKDR